MRAIVFAALVAFAAPLAAAQPPRAPVAATEKTAHAFAFPGLLGGEVRLADYRGRAILVVNTASECGYTGQYKGLQKLWSDYAARGLVVVGVPSNDFGGQEPGSEKEIKRFCELNYGVTFPMAAKSAVTGPGANGFYRWARTAFGPAGQPGWNFHKLLIGKDGRAIAAFPSRVAPDAPELKAAIDKAIAAN